METVAGYEPSRGMRTDAAPFNAPRGPRPSRNRRPHGKPQRPEAHAHAHTGPKPQREAQRQEGNGAPAGQPRRRRRGGGGGQRG